MLVLNMSTYRSSYFCNTCKKDVPINLNIEQLKQIEEHYKGIGSHVLPTPSFIMYLDTHREESGNYHTVKIGFDVQKNLRIKGVSFVPEAGTEPKNETRVYNCMECEKQSPYETIRSIQLSKGQLAAIVQHYEEFDRMETDVWIPVEFIDTHKDPKGKEHTMELTLNQRGNIISYQRIYLIK
jgi:DNA-directed RNA polymerase subunit RPC12/RpoP